MDLIIGDRAVREALENGMPIVELEQGWQRELDDYRRALPRCFALRLSKSAVFSPFLFRVKKNMGKQGANPIFLSILSSSFGVFEYVSRECTLQQLADLVGGRVDGDPQLAIHGLNGIEYAQAGEITFILDKKQVPLAENCQASACIVPVRRRFSADSRACHRSAFSGRCPYPLLPFKRTVSSPRCAPLGSNRGGVRPAEGGDHRSSRLPWRSRSYLASG